MPGAIHRAFKAIRHIEGMRKARRLRRLQGNRLKVSLLSSE